MLEVQIWPMNLLLTTRYMKAETLNWQASEIKILLYYLV